MYSTFNKKTFRSKGRYMNHSKYYQGRMYDSIREANHAEELDWRIKEGEVKEVIPQFKIDLRVNDRHIANYYLDFKVILPDNSVEFHEVKGMISPLWQMKWALLEALLPNIEPGAELVVIK